MRIIGNWQSVEWTEPARRDEKSNVKIIMILGRPHVSRYADMQKFNPM